MSRNPLTGEELPNGWRLVRVDDIKSPEKYSCVAGPFGSDISSQYFQDHGVPIIRGNNLSLEGEKFVAGGFVFVSKERAEKYKAQRVKANDLVFTCWGTIGQVGIIPEDGPFREYIISNKQLKLRVDETIVNPLFLYYYFSSKAVFKYLNNIAIGSAVPGINLGILKNFPVPLAPKHVQDKIVFILDEIYQLIENNKKRIKLLEEMAEEIYKEWFVRFRFPGYESTRFLDEKGKEVPHGTLGALPEGWENAGLENQCSFVMGQSPSSDYYNTDGQGLPFHQGVTNFNERFPTHEIYCTDEKRIANQGDILLSVRAPVGRINVADQKLVIGRGISAIRHKRGFNSYCYYLLKSVFAVEDQFGNGAVFNAVTKEELLTIKAVKPPEDVSRMFQNLVLPFDNEIEILTQKNRLLKETRDLLLPRLISGKLLVEHLIKNEAESFAPAEPDLTYG